MAFGLGQCPKPNASLPGFLFQHKQRRIVTVLAIHPGSPSPDHFGINIEPIGIDAPDGPPVAIAADHHYRHIFAEHQVGQHLLGAGAVGLPPLGGVDFGEADLGLLMVGVKNGDGVAISDADHAPGNLGG